VQKHPPKGCIIARESRGDGAGAGVGATVGRWSGFSVDVASIARASCCCPEHPAERAAREREREGGGSGGERRGEGVSGVAWRTQTLQSGVGGVESLA